MKKKIVLLNEGQYRLLFENDNEEYIEKIKSLINSGQIENIETALEMGKWMKAEGIFDVEQYLKDKYQFVIDFIIKYSLEEVIMPIKNKTFSQQLEYVLNLDFVMFYDNELEFPSDVQEKIKQSLPNTLISFSE